MMAARPAWAPVVRGLFLVAMALFVVTVVIGIVNGLDLYEFDRNQILTHVHSGTLGWVTLGLVAGGFWLARAADRRLAIALAVLIPVYVAAFYSGSLPARAVTGTLLLIAILWLVGWAWWTLAREPTIAFLAVTLGLTSFAYGAIIGVLIQIQLASGTVLFPGGADAIGAHAGTMVFSYLILVAMGLLEWRLVGLRRRSRAGLVQIVALFGGGLLLALTLLFLDESATQIVGGIYLLVELIAVGIFTWRVVRTAVRSRLADGDARATRRGLGRLRRHRDGDLPVRRVPVHLDRRPVEDPAGRARRERPHGVHRRHHEPDLRAGARSGRRPSEPLGMGRPGRVLGDERRSDRLPRRA